MQRLRLADPGQLANRGQLANAGMLSEYDVNEFYINVPTDEGGIIRVREDYFDQYSPSEYRAIMDYLEEFQGDNTMSGLFSGMRERRDERRAKREAKREDKQEFKLAKQEKRGETFGKIIDTAKNIFGKGEADTMPMQYKDLDLQGGIDFGYQNQPQGMSQGTKTILIVGGVALGGLLLYKLATKSKKRK